VEARWECPVGPTRPGLSQAALPSEVPLPLEPDRKAEIEMVVASLQSLPVNRPAGYVETSSAMSSRSVILHEGINSKVVGTLRVP
jgi:hypothetical protein